MTTTPEQDQPIYRVIFVQNETLYEVYARYLTEESLMGFIEIEELIFQDTTSSVLVDPAEEKLRAEFKDVKRSYIPLHTILRIDEVVKEGAVRMQPSEKIKKGNVSHLTFTPSK
ncbi:MAG: DUF1820 family protein [Gammaproteobacteria bacterium]|nr:DUF1820 family protein [Gammaproteobacteria bacterium]